MRRFVTAYCSLLVAVFMLAAMPAGAGERTSARSMSMARTFVASSRGVDAVGVNPANLALPDEGTVTLSLMPLGFHVGSELLNYDIYTRYFTGVESDNGRTARTLSEEDKDRLLSSIKTGVPESRVDVDVMLLGLSLRLQNVGMIAFSVTDHLAGAAFIPRDYVEFLFHGNPAGSVYDFRETKALASWTREYALSFGGALPAPSFLHKLTGGATVKVVHGFGYYGIERFNSSLTTSNDGRLTGKVDFLARYTSDDPFGGSFTMFPAPAGRGLGFDLGVTGLVTEYLAVGLSVTDIGSVKWTQGIQESFADTTLMVDDPLIGDQRDAIERALKGNKREGGSFSSSLPTTLRFGAALEVHKMLKDFGDELVIALDYNQGLVVTSQSTTTPRVSLGVEYKPLAWLPIRSGVSAGGTDGFNVAMGLGFLLGAFELEVASENISWLAQPNSFSHGSLALGTRFRF